MKFPFSRALVLITLGLGVTQVQASVVIGGTRVVYPAQAREVTVQLDNAGEAPALVQAWVDSGDPEQTAESSDAPFVLTPPISRVEAGRSQALRLIFTGAGLPADRESLFWLNVLDMPPSPQNGGDEQNYLQVAFRSRVKLFYRPSDLPGDANDAPATLRWSQAGGQLHVFNPSPYHITLAEVHVTVAGAEQLIERQGKMVGPEQKLSFPINGSADDVRMVTINDYGGRVEQRIKLEGGR